jgi:hypothetical protein
MTSPTSRNLKSAICILHSAICLLFLSSCSQVRRASPADAFSDEDKLSYLVLAALSPDAAQQYASAGSAQNRADYLDWFWHNPPPLSVSPPSSLLTPPSSLLPSPASFYRQRAIEARGYFGATDLLNDDRVLTYIRQGPARREQYEPRVVETESTRIFVNPAEIWSYDSIGRQFDFVRTGTAYKIVGESRYGRSARMPELELLERDRQAAGFPNDARPLGLEISLGRLGQHGDSVEVELAFGIPQRALPAEKGLRPVSITFDIVPRSKGTPVHRPSLFGCPLPIDTSVVEFAVGREIFDLPANIYTFTVTAVSADGLSASRKSQDLNLIDYSRRDQPVSDVLFYSLVDSTPQSPQFGRPDWARVVPLVAPRVRSGQSFYVLYEIYHLGLDSTGNHNAQVNYELVQRETREKAVLPTPRRYVTGMGTTGVAVERVHTMDLKPGPYLLISRVTDMLHPPDASPSTSVTAEFEILPRR